MENELSFEEELDNVILDKVFSLLTKHSTNEIATRTRALMKHRSEPPLGIFEYLYRNNVLLEVNKQAVTLYREIY